MRTDKQLTTSSPLPAGAAVGPESRLPVRAPIDSRRSWLRDTYYFLKPFLPWSFRIRLRRIRAHRRRQQFAATWPVDAASARVPPKWPGWPGGKQFAFVLTHDVENATGLSRCQALAQLEQDAGFASSFNFIPEGEYRVSESLRKQLEHDGFEVGVHDLKHDGKLYQSEAAFQASARRINQYLKEWNATGFRSGFMHHNLAWIRQLEVLYDASTFDTDPFEPQPDGVGTIFPFWVEGGKDSQGYVELPYTLAQDITVFIILQEKTVDLWKRKLDWVASQGGMALLNVHPDYVCFSGTCLPQEFPAALYREFLAYVRERYGSSAWCVLPRDLAAFAAQNKDCLFRHVCP